MSDGSAPAIIWPPASAGAGPLGVADDASVPPWAAQALIAAGQRMDRFGWVPATAGNLSLRLGPGRIAITRSGVHKGFLTQADLIVVNGDGQPLQTGQKASAETLLHCQIYRRLPSMGAVLHGHSVPATALSMHEQVDTLHIAGYELLKAFPGQTTHAASLPLPLIANDQDIARMAEGLEAHFPDNLPLGYVIRGHGVYAWGEDMPTALARLEGLEFLLACELERRPLS